MIFCFMTVLGGDSPLSTRQIPAQLRLQSRAQGVEADKAFRVRLAARAAIIFEGHHVLVMEVFGRAAIKHGDGATDRLLAGVGQHLQHSAFREPIVDVVDEAGIARCEFVLQVRHFAVKGERLHSAVRFEQDGAVGRYSSQGTPLGCCQIRGTSVAAHKQHPQFRGRCCLGSPV